MGRVGVIAPGCTRCTHAHIHTSNTTLRKRPREAPLRARAKCAQSHRNRGVHRFESLVTIPEGGTRQSVTTSRSCGRHGKGQARVPHVLHSTAREERRQDPPFGARSLASAVHATTQTDDTHPRRTLLHIPPGTFVGRGPRPRFENLALQNTLCDYFQVSRTFWRTKVTVHLHRVVPLHRASDPCDSPSIRAGNANAQESGGRSLSVLFSFVFFVSPHRLSEA